METDNNVNTETTNSLPGIHFRSDGSGRSSGIVCRCGLLLHEPRG